MLSWLLLFSLSIGNAAAQEITGSISGIVSDSSGALIPGVKVTVTNTGTNVSKTVVTGASGAYRVPFLFFGTYQVKAEHDGFKTSQMDNVTLSTSEDVRADLTLSVGEVTEVVEVSGMAVALKTEEASVATTIVKEQLVQLPLVGRQVIGATLLAPAPISSTTTVRHSGIRALCVATDFRSASMDSPISPTSSITMVSRG